MKYIIVDDEQSALKDLEAALKTAQPDCEPELFTRPSKALAYAKENTVEIAFLDVEMGSTNGLVLAKQLKDIQPDIHIIFVTGYEQYALGAIKLHATGYLMKPATAEDIQRELTFIYGEKPSPKRIHVQTFGGFEVSVNGTPLTFGRSKAKELLAFLIDRKGKAVTSAEACAALWEDDADETKSKDYLRVLLKDLRRTLKTAAVEDLLVKTFNSLAIHPELLDCDSYRFFEGDAEAVNQYRQNYLPEYTWAEFTLGEMERRFNHMTNR